MNIKYLAIALFLYFSTTVLCAVTTKQHKILFISSYNNSFPTIDNQIKGLKEILDKSKYQLDFEFMDTKRFNPKDVEPLFYNLLTMKKELLKSYDVIVIGDDNALRFAKKYQDEFFLNKPIVFFGINNISFAKEMIKNKFMTGVKEESSIPETINMIKRLHPSKKKILTITDNTVTSKGIVDNFEKEISQKLKLLNSSDYTFEELKEKLKKIKEGEPLLFISAFKDKDSKIIEFLPSVNLIKNNTNSPVYHFYEHGIGDGLIGGKVVMFKDQGRKAGQLVKEIIKGRNIATIPLQETQNAYLFDYEELIKYQLLKKIPNGSVVINQPKNLLKQSIEDLLPEIVTFLIFVFLWSTFLLFRLRKKSKRIEKAYVDIQNLMNGTVEGIIISKENICKDVNTSVLKILELKKEEIIGKNLRELFTEESLEKFDKNFEDGLNKSYEAYMLNSKGESIPFLIKEKEIEFKNELVRVSSIVDLTEVKDKEKLLQEQAKMAAIGDMISNISHQWRQPLNVISTVANNWKVFEELGELDKKTILEETDIIIKNSQYLSSTINDFMYFLKNDNTSSEFTITELLNDVLGLEKSFLQMTHIKPIINIKSESKLTLNKNKLLQAFVNIFNNCIEALAKNEEGNRILIVIAEEKNNFVNLRIIDNAGGIEDDIISKIFEPYTSTKEQLNGFGLGLYMTYTILNKMNSQIKIENKGFKLNNNHHKGVEITINLPLV